METLSEDYIRKSYKEPTEQFNLGKWRPVPITVSKGLSGGGYKYSIKTPSGKVHTRLWAYPENSYNQLLKKNRIYFGKDNSGIPQKIIYAHESQGQPTTNYWDSTSSNKEGKKEILNLFNGNYFDTPKPTKLLIRLMNLILNNNDLILDFFSGSATTAHALMQLNAQDKGNRRYILVQLPEPTDPKSEAYKAGYKNICEIGKERIRRAGEKIVGSETLVSQKDGTKVPFPDIGFKVFKLDSSNIKEWDSDYRNLEKNLLDTVDNIKPDRTREDLLYEILLKYGLDLTIPIEEELTLTDKKVFVIGLGSLVVCLDNNITLDTVEAIAKLKEKYQTDTMRVVFKDNGFDNSETKTNAIQILKQYGVDDVKRDKYRTISNYYKQ